MAKWIEDPQGRLEVEKVTEELKLPVWKANYKGKFREFWNECWEKIEDSFLKLKKSNEGKEPAITTKETAFNKPFGVSEDTVLEGNKFTQMTGKDYGGILNIAGQKEAGKAYWDNNTKKLYICKNNNSDISPNVNNYIPFDSNSLLERLENLFKINNLKYDSGNIKILINQQWQNIGIIDISDKYINIVVFNFLGDKSLNYSFHTDNLKFEKGYYFLINSTPGFGYSGAYIRIIGNNIQLKSTGDSSHSFYLRSLQIYN